MKKPKYELRILSPAQHELEDIARIYLEISGEISSREIIKKLYHSMELLQITPYIGILCRDKSLRLKGYRILISGKYLCIYRVLENIIFIYHIVDARPNYPKLMKDLSSSEIP